MPSKRLARSRTAPARPGERARIVLLSRQGDTVAEIVEQLGVCPDTVRRWLHRFDRHGVDGLTDQRRSGRPPTYAAEASGAVVEASLTTPQALGVPFACWTLDRLAADLNEEKAIPLKRSRISERLIAAGLRGRQQEPWFGERVDPAVAATRGRSSRATRPHRRAAS